MKKILYHRNWKEVCKLQDDDLKYLVTWTEDDRTIAGLNKAFPKLFLKQEGSIKIPFSALKRRALLGIYPEFRDYGDSTVDDLRWEECFGIDIHYHRFPEIWFFGTETIHQVDATEIPEEIAAQLRGRTAVPGMTVKLNGQELAVLRMDIGEEHSIGREIPDDPTITVLGLVPVQYIDFKS